ncbi:MAG TPA: hypothetical protein VGD79_13225 [Thermoanaerobaculia bacterium]|jgi:hypothetical protein
MLRLLVVMWLTVGAAADSVTLLAPDGLVREGAVGISPVDARIAVVAGILNVPNAPAKVLVWRTTDGGVTWTRTADLPLQIGGDSFTGHYDPAIAFDATGRAFLTTVGTTPARAQTSIVVFRSNDGGATWTGVYARPINDMTQDKPWIAAANGTVHLIWAEFRFGGGGAILYARSSDSGSTWTAPAEITASVGWPIVAASPNGPVTASYANATTSAYDVRTSIDGGATFGGAVRAGTYGGCVSSLPDVGMQQLAADSGHLYAVFCGTNANGKGVLFTRSTDGGANWATPVLVSGNADIALPAVAVDNRTGDVVVAWIDGRHAAGTKSGRLYATRSTDGGATFEAALPLGAAFSADGFIGDYNQLAAADGLTLATFSDATGHFSVARIGEPRSEPPAKPSRRRTVRH